ncbi:unnamed protein product [Clavelina lepadiformis]|uniref:Clathrin/coatomer adaptor adaptin-like N-terminal domain-containing protein n=1 Tax=Clavelina lepadiformis TaxID=159417 RepID=A0ABP0FZ22_CLALP
MAEKFSDLTRHRFTKFHPTHTTSTEKQLKFLEEQLIFKDGDIMEDEEDLILDIIHLLSSKDLRVKKLVYLYLSLVRSGNSDKMEHATNSILQDLADANALVRRTVLRSLSELRMSSPVLNGILPSAIMTGLDDSSPNVRCIALDAIIQINQVNEDASRVSNDAFESMLKKTKLMITNDTDPSVVVRSLECLAVCKCENKIIQDSLSLLLDRLTILDDSLAVSVLNRANLSLCCRSLKEDEVYALLNKLDPLKSLSVDYLKAIQTMCLMYSVSANVNDVKKEIVKQITMAMLSLYTMSNQDVKYILLCSLHTIASLESCAISDLFENEVRHFLLLSSDCTDVMIKKLEILRFCLTHHTAELILSNVRVYLHKSHWRNVVETAFKTFEDLHVFLPEKCNNVLTMLLHSATNAVLDPLVLCVYRIYFKYLPSDCNYSLPPQLLSALMKCYKHLNQNSSKCSFWWVMCVGSDISHSKQLSMIIKDEIVTSFSNDNLSSSTFHHCILTSTVKLFLKWPKTFVNQLKSLFSTVLTLHEHCSLKDQGKRYYKLLKQNRSLLEKLVESSIKMKLPSESKTIMTNNLNSLSQVSVPV